MLQMSETTGALFAAIAKAQGETGNATKRSKNPAFKSTYANYTEMVDTIHPPYSANGLCITQHPQLDDGVVTLTTLVGHESGEWISSSVSVPVSKHDAHGVGGAITYACRYALAAICGVGQEDDDGNSTVGLATPAKETKVEQAKPKTPALSPFDMVKEETLNRLETAFGDRTSAIVAVNKALDGGRARGIKSPEMIRELKEL